MTQYRIDRLSFIVEASTAQSLNYGRATVVALSRVLNLASNRKPGNRAVSETRSVTRPGFSTSWGQRAPSEKHCLHRSGILHTQASSREKSASASLRHHFAPQLRHRCVFETCPEANKPNSTAEAALFPIEILSHRVDLQLGHRGTWTVCAWDAKSALERRSGTTSRSGSAKVAGRSIDSSADLGVL